MPSGVYFRTQQTRENISKTLKGRPQSEESNRKRSETEKSQEWRSQNEPWNKGKHLSEEDKLHKSQAKKGVSHSLTHNIHSGIGQLGKVMSPGSRLAMSEGQKIYWANSSDEEKERRISAVMSGNNTGLPTKPELKIIAILNTLFPEEYKFTGKGDVIIGGMCPDFTNINGQKKVIEMFGDYWHKDEKPEDRINKFHQYGFNCLVIWEHELKNINNVIQRIINFHTNITHDTTVNNKLHNQQLNLF